MSGSSANIIKEIPPMEKPLGPPPPLFPGLRTDRGTQAHNSASAQTRMLNESENSVGVSIFLCLLHLCQRAVLERCLCSPFLSFFSETEPVSAIPLLSNLCFLERLYYSCNRDKVNNRPILVKIAIRM